MKYTILTIILVSYVIGYNASAQNIVVGKLQNNVLYAGYENKVELSTRDLRSFEIVPQNEALINVNIDSTINTQSNNEIQNFIIRPLTLTKQKQVLYFKDPTTNEIFDSVLFIVKPLPTPIVYLGSIPEGEIISKSESLLTYRFQENISIDIQFEIISWKLIVDGKSEIISGQGNSLNEVAIFEINSAKPGTLISFTVEVRYSNGEIKEKAATFKK